MLLMTRRAFDSFILLQVPPAKSAMEQPQVRLNKAMKMKTSSMSQERHKVCMCIEDCKQSEYMRGLLDLKKNQIETLGNDASIVRVR